MYTGNNIKHLWKKAGDLHESNKFFTQRWMVDKIEECFNARIGFDPCNEDSNPTNAKIFLTNKGLTSDWSGLDNIYCNPPYGRRKLNWVKKSLEQASIGKKVILLLPMKSDTLAVQLCLRRFSSMLLFKRRICFDTPRGEKYSVHPMVLFGFNVSLTPFADDGTLINSVD